MRKDDVLFAAQAIPWTALLMLWLGFAMLTGLTVMALALASVLLRGLAHGISTGTFALLALLLKAAPKMKPPKPKDPTATAPVTPSLAGGGA